MRFTRGDVRDQCLLDADLMPERASKATDKLESAFAARNPRQAWHWMRLTMGATSIARMTESIRRAKRVINQFLEGGCNTSPFVLGLLH